MNREKKQLVVVGVLVVLVLGIGAFQFTRQDAPPPPASTKEKAKSVDETEKTAVPTKNYPELMDLQQRDPFEIAAFVAGSNPQPTIAPIPKPAPVSGTVITDPSKKGLDALPGPELPWQAGGIGDVKPIEPPKPVFGYTLVGIVEGAHPMAVFQDEKGNQQLVEAGQSIGSSATITHISRGKVRVKFNAETLVLNVGGNPNAK